MAKHVAVLLGGWSAEREVSLNSGKGVVEALQSKGYKVTAIDVDRNIVRRLQEVNPDVAFNALHGTFGEDGGMQGVLEMLGIPYTHSGVLASALAMDKPMAKRLFSQAGIPTPIGKVVTKDSLLKEDPLPRPYVLKPRNEGSSVGVHIMLENDNRSSAVLVKEYGNDMPDELLAEHFIAGREISVAVMGEGENAKALGVVEIQPVDGFYDYKAKYTEGKAVHILPAPLPETYYNMAMDYALRAHIALGCRGVSRADLRFNDTIATPEIYLLEVNTNPGMTALSLVPEIAESRGIHYPELVAWMVENATCDAVANVKV